MFKLILPLLCFVALAQAQCPYGSTNLHGGYTTRYCYKYLGNTSNYAKAVKKCAEYNLPLVMPKTDAGLDDLYSLYKGYPNYYFWVGASALPSNPHNFVFQDNNPLFPTHYCSGHPKGKNNLCGFYTTTVGVGRDRCISTGPCEGSFFDHGILCQTTF